jgi:hypothetical protein
MMAERVSRAVFDGLLAKTHVQHALVQLDGQYNQLPSVSLRPAEICSSRTNTSRPWLRCFFLTENQTSFRQRTTR